MKGSEARGLGRARLYQRIALNAAFQAAVLTRVKDPKAQMARFEQAFATGPKTSIADRLVAMKAAGVPMTITVTRRE